MTEQLSLSFGLHIIYSLVLLHLSPSSPGMLPPPRQLFSAQQAIQTQHGPHFPLRSSPLPPSAQVQEDRGTSSPGPTSLTPETIGVGGSPMSSAPERTQVCPLLATSPSRLPSSLTHSVAMASHGSL